MTNEELRKAYYAQEGGHNLYPLGGPHKVYRCECGSGHVVSDERRLCRLNRKKKEATK